MKALVNHLAGLSAEMTVARDYEYSGWSTVQDRWRSRYGEIDLIVTDGIQLVFVEVKKSRSFAQAAVRVSAKQQQRIQNAALDYLAQSGGSLDCEMRFDVALVDQHGCVKRLENAFGHDYAY